MDTSLWNCSETCSKVRKNSLVKKCPEYVHECEQTLNCMTCLCTLQASLYVLTWVLNLKQILPDNSYKIWHQTTCDMSCIYCLFTNTPMAKVAMLSVVYTRDPTVLISAHWKESQQTACMEESINKPTVASCFYNKSWGQELSDTICWPSPRLRNVLTFFETYVPKSLGIFMFYGPKRLGLHTELWLTRGVGGCSHYTNL